MRTLLSSLPYLLPLSVLLELAFSSVCLAQRELRIERTEVANGGLSLDWHEFNDMLSPDVVIFLEHTGSVPESAVIQVEPTTVEGYKYLLTHPYVGTTVAVPQGGGVSSQNFGVRSGSPFNILNGKAGPQGGPPMHPGMGGRSNAIKVIESSNEVVRGWASTNGLARANFEQQLAAFIRSNIAYSIYNNSGSMPPWNHRVDHQIDAGSLLKSSDKHTKVKGKAGEDVTFSFATSSDVRFTPWKTIKGFDGNTELFSYSTQAANFSIYVPSNTTTIDIVDNTGNYENIPFGPPGGIDFQNLTVSAIDADAATGTVNFLLGKGNKINESGTRATQQAAFLKKIFLQALTLPKNEWKVGLEFTTPVGGEDKKRVAVATSSLKKTDFVDILFAADYKAKDEFVGVLSGSLTDGVPVQQKFLEIICSLNASLAATMFEKYFSLIPQQEYRLTIIPRLPNSEDNAEKIYIKDAKVGIKLALVRIQPQPHPYTQQEQDLIDAAIRDFSAWLDADRLSTYATLIAQRINEGATPEYQALADIYPALVAAEWYKQQDRGTLGGQLDYLIDKKLLDDATAKVNIARQGTFDPSAWEVIPGGSGDPFIVSSCGLSYRYSKVTEHGGVNADRTQVSDQVISSAHEQLINQGLSLPVLENNDTSFFNAGAISTHLPDLAVNSLTVKAADKGAPIADLTSYVEFTIGNFGSESVSNIRFKLSLQNMSTQEVKTTYLILSGVDGLKGKYVRYPLGRLDEGAYQVTVYVDRTFEKTEKTEWNNFLSLDFDVITPKEITKIDVPILFNPQKETLVYGPAVELSAKLSGTINVRAASKNEGVKLLPGFSFTATEGSSLSIQAGWSQDAANASSRVSSSQADDWFDNQGTTITGSEVRQGSIKELATKKRAYISKNLYRIIPDSVPKSREVPPPVLSQEDQQILDLFDQIYHDDSSQTEQTTPYVSGSSDETFGIYPNPTTDILNVTHQLGDVTRAVFSIYDIDGKLIRKVNTSEIKVENNGKLTLDVSDLSKGLYVLQAQKKFNYKATFIKK